MAEYYYDLACEQEIRMSPDWAYYLLKTNEELVELTEDSDEGIIIGIRNYWKEKGKLSEKQRGCLVRWIAYN